MPAIVFGFPSGVGRCLLHGLHNGKGCRPQKLIFIADMSAEGGGGKAKPLSAKKMYFFVVEGKCLKFYDFCFAQYVR